MMKRTVTLILLSLVCGIKAGAQSALEVPPVSDPVCIYCGTNRSDGPRLRYNGRGEPTGPFCGP